MKTISKVIVMIVSLSIAAFVLSGCLSIKEKTEDMKKTTIDSFSTINLDVEVAEVDIIPEADEFAIEYHIVNQDVAYSVKDGALTIKVGGGNEITINRNEQSYIKLYVPEGSEFTSINYEGDVGDIHIESIKADDMSIETEVGNAILSDIKVNNNLSVETEVGNVEVALANDDCSYNISAEAAKILINGKEFSGVNVEKNYTSENGPQVNITTETGNISFNCKMASK